jgi:hypothetical protein
LGASTYRITGEDIKLPPYKIQRHQDLARPIKPGVLTSVVTLRFWYTIQHYPEAYVLVMGPFSLDWLFEQAEYACVGQ